MLNIEKNERQLSQFSSLGWVFEQWNLQLHELMLRFDSLCLSVINSKLHNCFQNIHMKFKFHITSFLGNSRKNGSCKRNQSCITKWGWGIVQSSNPADWDSIIFKLNFYLRKIHTWPVSVSFACVFTAGRMSSRMSSSSSQSKASSARGRLSSSTSGRDSARVQSSRPWK